MTTPPTSPRKPLSPEYLAEITARAEAATAGPWCTDGAEIYQGDEYAWDAFWVGETCRADEADGGTVDAAFIAHARTDVPALLAEVQRLRVELDKRTAQYAEAAAALAEQVQRSGQRMREHNADREELERLRAKLAARPTRAEVLRKAAPEMDAIAHEYGVFGVGSRLRQLADDAEAGAPR